jgi:SAM-dependent MidA family methyltransferase
MSLRQILQREISAVGAIPFSRFMELALYCPEYGYYQRPDTHIGRRGDFFTSVSVGPLFGELLAFQFAQWLQGARGKIHLVEAGAHDGALARDILGWFRQHQPDLYAQLEYWIIEPIAVRTRQQKATLEDFADKVRWYENVSALPAIEGIIFANELLDSFPINRYAWDAPRRCWFEWGVAWESSRFVWKRLPDTETLVRDPFRNTDTLVRDLFRDAGLELPQALLDVLPDGYTVDLSPAAGAWWREAARRLSFGKLLTIDYGLEAEQLLSPERTTGTLRAYYEHHPVTACGESADLLANPGLQDLTAHVNFTQLRRAGEAEGLHTETFCTQEKFLTQIAQRTLHSKFGQWTPEKTRQFQTLTHPEHLARNFKVLVQSKRL